MIDVKHAFESFKNNGINFFTGIPDSLLKESDDLQIHKVEHINPLLRITELNYERDYDKEIELM